MSLGLGSHQWDIKWKWCMSAPSYLPKDACLACASHLSSILSGNESDWNTLEWIEAGRAASALET